MKRLLRYGPFLIVLAAVLWGLDGILRRSLFSLAPIIIVFYEHLIGAIIIVGILGLTIDLIFKLLYKMFFPWAPKIRHHA